MTERVAVIGLGYVGVVTAAWLAERNHHVIGFDVSRDRVSLLRTGALPFYEPGLDVLVSRELANGRLSVTDDVAEAVHGASMVFLAVGTPKGDEGEADLRQVDAAVEEVLPHLDPGALVVIKSTVPMGTAERARERIRAARGAAFPFAVLSNPEFLQQGRAVESLRAPDRIIIGGDDPEAVDRLAALYAGVGPILKTDHRTAEMIKYASNAALATRISYANEMAKLCDALGVDFLAVARGVGMDRRIGLEFLTPGPGFGGSCFPKDVAALVALGERHGVEMILLKEVLRVNHRQPRYVFDKLRRLTGPVRGKIVTLLGLSFKARTDDVRESPSLDLARILLSEGALVRAYDPVAERNSQHLLPTLRYYPDPYEAAAGAEAVVICTEWPEFGGLDLERLRSVMAEPILVDARNVVEPDRALALGLQYAGIGRGDGGP